MKKTFMAPTVSTVDIKAESLLNGASTIQSGSAEHTDGGIEGGNGGDGLAKAGGMSTIGRASAWAAGKMEF